MAGTVHIIGAGLAGLAAAVRLTSQGRARRGARGDRAARAAAAARYHDPSARHDDRQRQPSAVVRQSRRARTICAAIGAEARLIGPPSAEFAFVDLASGARWTLRFNDGPIPWWVFDHEAAGAGHRRARLSAAGAASVGAGRQVDRRSHRLHGPALRAPARAASARRAQYRSAATARRGSPAPSSARRWRIGGRPAGR